MTIASLPSNIFSLYGLNLFIASLLISGIAWIAYSLLKSQVRLTALHRFLTYNIYALIASPMLIAMAGLMGLGALDASPKSLEISLRPSIEAAPIQEQPADFSTSLNPEPTSPSSQDPSHAKTELTFLAISPVIPESGNRPFSSHPAMSLQSILYGASSILLGLWAFGSIALVIRFARGILAVHKLRRSASRVNDPRILRAIHHGKTIQRINRKIEVLASESLQTPLVIGVRRPAIVVPVGLASHLDQDQLESVMLHELAHIQRNDITVGILQRWNSILFWWNPIVHLLHRAMNQVREWICDDVAIVHSNHSHSLAYAILAIAEGNDSQERRATNLPAIGFSEEARGVQARILRLIEPSCESRKWERLPSLLVIFLALSLLLPTFMPVLRISSLRQVEHPTAPLNAPAINHPQITNDDLPWKVRVRAVDGETGKAIATPSFGIQYTSDLLSASWKVGDENGEGEILSTSRTPSYCYLKARADGYAPIQGFWKNQAGSPVQELPEELVFTMTKAITVGGTIVDEEGEPVEGATVILSAGTHHSGQVSQLVSTFYGEKMTTNAQGEWRCGLVPADCNSASIQVSHPKYVDHHVTVSLDRDIPELISFEHRYSLKKGFILTGQVLDENGEPVPRAVLSIAELNLTSDKGPFAMTDEQGFYQFVPIAPRLDARLDQINPMTMSVFVARPGYAPIHRAIPGFARASMEGSTEEERVVNFELTQGTTVELKVVDSAGKPIPGVTILPWEWDSVTNMTVLRQAGLAEQTDAQGKWSWTWAPKNQRIRYHLFVKGFMDIRDLDIEPGENGVTKTIVLKRPQVLIGNVIDEVTKKPIPEFIIEHGFEKMGREYPDGIWWVEPKSIGKDGAFRIEMTMPPSNGTYAYRAVAKGYKSSVKKSVRFEEGEKKIDFSLVPLNK